MGPAGTDNTFCASTDVSSGFEVLLHLPQIPTAALLTTTGELSSASAKRAPAAQVSHNLHIRSMHAEMSRNE